MNFPFYKHFLQTFIQKSWKYGSTGIYLSTLGNAFKWSSIIPEIFFSERYLTKPHDSLTQKLVLYGSCKGAYELS